MPRTSADIEQERPLVSVLGAWRGPDAYPGGCWLIEQRSASTQYLSGLDALWTSQPDLARAFETEAEAALVLQQFPALLAGARVVRRERG